MWDVNCNFDYQELDASEGADEEGEGGWGLLGVPQESQAGRKLSDLCVDLI